MKKLLFFGAAALAVSAATMAYTPETVGIGIMGSSSLYNTDQTQIYYPVPLVNVNYNNFFVDGNLNVGYNLVNEPGFTLSAYVDPLSGYWEGFTLNANNLKSNMQNINNRYAQANVGLAANFVWNDHAQGKISYEEGWRGPIGAVELDSPWMFGDKVTVTPSFVANYYGQSYMQYFFGINGQQVAANPGITSTYNPGEAWTMSGVLNAQYAMTMQWTLNGFIGYEYLPKGITNSPIVAANNSMMYAGMGIRYSFL